MTRLSLVVGLAFGVSALSPLAAQDPAAPHFVMVTSVSVRPAGMTEFEDYVRKINAAAVKIGLKERVDAYQGFQGASPYDYDFVSESESLAALDNALSVPAILVKAHGEAEGQKVLRAGRAHVQTIETLVVRTRPELSTKPKPIAAANFVQLVRAEIDPAMTTQYEQYLTRVKSAGDKHAAAPSAYRHTTVFGQAGIYVTVLPFMTWADRAKWPAPGAILEGAFGQAEAQTLQETARKATKRQDIWVLAYRRDLSRGVPASTN